LKENGVHIGIKDTVSVTAEARATAQGSTFVYYENLKLQNQERERPL